MQMAIEVTSIKRTSGRLRQVVRVASVALLVASAGLTAGCTKEGTASESTKAAATGNLQKDFPEVLATIGNDKITLSDVESRAGRDLERIEIQYHQLRSTIVQAALDSMLRERTVEAEAKKQGKSVEQLVESEAGVAANPTDADITAWYKANPDRTGGRPIETVKTQIADLLKQQNMQAAADRLVARLNKEKNVKVNFEPYRLAFDNGTSPTMGKAGAPVTLVEFSDFQCPFCHRFAPILKQVHDKYGDKVQIVYRQYPIPSLHPFAFKAAEASLCANDQGKFWEFHDSMFSEQNKLGVADLKDKAARMGMDRKKFEQCLDTGRYTEQVQKDMADGSKIGVTGTPAVFINGFELKGGAVPLETVTAAIDRELARGETK